MLTNTQREARNARRRELRHLREDALRNQSSKFASNDSLTNSISSSPIIPSIVFRPRGRRPRQISAEVRRDLHNARRRELRHIQRNKNLDLQGIHEAASELQEQSVILPLDGLGARDVAINLQQQLVDEPHYGSASTFINMSENSSSQNCVVRYSSNPTQDGELASTDLTPRTSFRRGRPPRYASTQDRRNANNARRREQRQLHRTMHLTEHMHGDIASTIVPPRPSRRRGRPPRYTSAQDRRDATNARRRELRQHMCTIQPNTQEQMPSSSTHVTPASPTVVEPHTKIMDSGVQSLDFSDIQISEIKKKTASSILLSMETIPHCFLTADARVDKLIELLNEYNSLPVGLGGNRISIDDFVIKAVALALQKVPQCNSLWMNDFIRQYHNVNINIAVQTKNEIYLPVIRDADKKSLSKLAEEAKDLAKKANEDGLKPEDFEGGTFTVSNLGESLRIKQFCSIINPSQSCLLTVSSEVEKRLIPGARPDQFDPGSFISVLFKCDHRIVDGAIGAEFLKAFKDYLENPISLLP